MTLLHGPKKANLFLGLLSATPVSGHICKARKAMLVTRTKKIKMTVVWHWPRPIVHAAHPESCANEEGACWFLSHTISLEEILLTRNNELSLQCGIKLFIVTLIWKKCWQGPLKVHTHLVQGLSPQVTPITLHPLSVPTEHWLNCSFAVLLLGDIMNSARTFYLTPGQRYWKVAYL